MSIVLLSSCNVDKVTILDSYFYQNSFAKSWENCDDWTFEQYEDKTNKIFEVSVTTKVDLISSLCLECLYKLRQLYYVHNFEYDSKLEQDLN